MALLSYRERLKLLDELLTNGITVFKKLYRSEEQLRSQLIKGDHQALLAAEEERNRIQRQVILLEDRRKVLVPDGTGLLTYIKTMIGKSKQAALLAKLEIIQEELINTRVIHEVNRSLLEERIRFTRELQDTLSATRLTYDKKGQLDKGRDDPSKKIDRNC